MKKTIIAALVAALCASVSMASVLTVTSSTKDQQVYGDITNAPAFVGGSTVRVGYETVAKKGAAYIMVFPLPTLAPGDSISSASLYAYSTASIGNNKISFNFDVYGVRAANSSTVSTNDFYDGADDANATKVIEDYIQVITTNRTAVGAYYSSTNTTFGAWLASLYTGNVPNYSNAFVRMNADVAWANMTNSGGSQITSSFITMATGDTTNIVQRPLLTINTALADPVSTNIEASTSSLSITEGTTNSFQVRLSTLPAASVTVSVSRVSGSTQVQVLPDPTLLTFAVTNWDVYQSVYLESLTDGDISNDTATVECTDASGVYGLKSVQATQLDITPVALFSASISAGFAPLPVTFTDTSTGGITNRFWDFGDGATTNTTTNVVSHTYTVAGTTNTAQLTVSGPLGGNTRTMAINVPDSMKSLPVYDAFSDVVSANAIPAGWACFAPAASNSAAHSRIDSGSLSYSGLQDSAGNSWGLGEKTDDYATEFISPNLASGETVYFSFLMRLNTPLNGFSGGFFRLYDRGDPNGSGVNVGWGTSTTNNFTNTTTMGFTVNNRNAGSWNGAVLKTPETYIAADTTYLIVASYTRGTNQSHVADSSGILKMWINPDNATFGTATPPAEILSTNSYASDAIWNRLEFVSNGSSAGIPNWQVDEVRIATSWAAVVPAFSAPVGDIDSDGLPDSWETLYFGGSTNADPNAISANGINTVLQAYIAGLNPNDPQSLFRAAVLPPNVLSWNAASGRVYSVYWTTNLMNSFQLVATNVPWTQNSLTNSSPAASSFYKIDVRLQ